MKQKPRKEPKKQAVQPARTESRRAVLASEIMMEFARSTGLSFTDSPPRRYLWTDAFGVCNFLGLFRETGNAEYRELALCLVDQVHAALGRHAPGDARTGWISGLEGKEALRHPTAGGLRIGKKLRERRPTEPLDERLEWDRDGQYFHYLTKWMHALNCVARTTGDFTYNRWAKELARVAHAGFVDRAPPGKPKRMYWKMSTDLSYPLVQSMGHHDPLDGLITYAQLMATGDGEDEVDLGAQMADMTDMCRGRSWATDDPLGIGGLLADAHRVAQLVAFGRFPEPGLLAVLLDASIQGLEAFDGDHQLRLSADYRLAFRELGLSIGLRALARLPGLIGTHGSLFKKEDGLDDLLAALGHYDRFADAIEAFWRTPAHRERTWIDHQDINAVMLATSLFPQGYLML